MDREILIARVPLRISGRSFKAGDEIPNDALRITSRRGLIGSRRVEVKTVREAAPAAPAPSTPNTADDESDQEEEAPRARSSRSSRSSSRPRRRTRSA